MAMSDGQPEASTRYICKQCGGEFTPKSRKGEPREFCAAQCRYRWHNAQRLKGAALLKVRSTPVQRAKKSPKQTLDGLAAAEGLPSGCYPPGALGLKHSRRSVAAIIPATERLGLLVEAAKRLNLTEGEALTAARQAARLQGAA